MDDDNLLTWDKEFLVAEIDRLKEIIGKKSCENCGAYQSNKRWCLEYKCYIPCPTWLNLSGDCIGTSIERWFYKHESRLVTILKEDNDSLRRKSGILDDNARLLHKMIGNLRDLVNKLRDKNG